MSSLLAAGATPGPSRASSAANAISNESRELDITSSDTTSASGCSQLQAQSTALSIPYESVVGTLSDGVLQSMWSKASHLMSEGKVVKAPGLNSKTRWVASDSSASPHVVTTSKTDTGQYLCDNQCIGWKSRHICAHCLAAAEDNNELCIGIVPQSFPLKTEI